MKICCQYEYLRINFDKIAYGDKQLNSLGKQGWQLCTIIDRHTFIEAVFMRAINIATQQQIDEWREKADKWDALRNKIAQYNNDFFCIGKVATSAFGDSEIVADKNSHQ